MSRIGPPLALVDAHHALFQMAEARAPLEETTKFTADRPLWCRLLPATRWCTQHALAGDWPAAHAATLRTQDLRDAAPTQLNWFDFARHYETEALMRAGDRARAEADARRLRKQLGTNKRYHLVWLRMQALLDRDANHTADAISHLTEAHALATRLGLPGEAWPIAAELAQRYAHLGASAQAQASLTLAKTGITALAAQINDPNLRQHFSAAAHARLPTLG